VPRPIASALNASPDGKCMLHITQPEANNSFLSDLFADRKIEEVHEDASQ